MLIDVAIPGNRNVIKKEAEKILKHKDPIKEIQHMWNMNAKVIPEVTGANGTVSKSLRQYLSKYQESTKLRDYKKQSYWALHTHTMESAHVKVQNIFHRKNNITCSTNCKYRTAATLYTLETLICFRYIIVNILHNDVNEGDDDHHNNNNNNNSNNNSTNNNNNNNTKAHVIKITVTMIILQ